LYYEHLDELKNEASDSDEKKTNEPNEPNEPNEIYLRGLSKSDLEQDWKRCKENNLGFRCAVMGCDNIFMIKKELTQTSSKDKTKKNTHTQKVCDKKTHKVLKPFICSECEKQFFKKK
jgi:hypothetical protein